MRRSRPSATALGAALTLLVLVAITGNEWVTDYVARHNLFNRGLPVGIRDVALAFPWRFTPGRLETAFWLADTGGALIFIVLTMVLVSLLVRGGASSFGAVFFGTIGASMIAAVVASIVRGEGLYTDLYQFQYRDYGGRAGLLVQGGGTTYPFMFALVAGALAGIVAGMVAAATRRTTPAGGTGGFPTSGAPYPYQAPGYDPQSGRPAGTNQPGGFEQSGAPGYGSTRPEPSSGGWGATTPTAAGSGGPDPDQTSRLRLPGRGDQA